MFKMLLVLAASAAPAFAQSLYQERANAISRENAERDHALYRQRTAEMVGRIERKLNQDAAAYGGATNFAYQCTPGVSGTTFLTCGISFQTVGGDVGCQVDNFSYDFIRCKGPDFTNCPDFYMRPVCIDANKQSFYLEGKTARRSR